MAINFSDDNAQLVATAVAIPPAPEFVRQLIDAFRNGPRMGECNDAPQGARFIQFSDTLAHHIADALEKEVLPKLESPIDQR